MDRVANPLGEGAQKSKLRGLPLLVRKLRGIELTELNRIVAARDTYVPLQIDIARLRGTLGMTQAQFARRFGFPVATLRHWERGDRTPRRAALALLNLIERDPLGALKNLKARPWE